MSTKTFEHALKLVLSEAVNHLGEKEYYTYAGWKKALKKYYPDKLIKFTGDKDIDGATVDGNFVGEWDGSCGSVKVLNNRINEQYDDLEDSPKSAAEDSDIAAWERSLDRGTNPDDFNTEDNPRPAISSKNLDIAKQWVNKIEQFKSFINGLEPNSLAVQLNRMDRDGSVFRGIVKQESKRLIRIAEALGGFNEILRSYIIGAEKKARDLQAQTS